MSEKFQLQLPKSCHENWDNMNPVEQGRFCNSCQKAVVDFTGMSDAQLVAFFKKPTTGSVCGRFDNDQLGREILIPGKRMPWLKYFLNLLVPTFLFACKAKSQGEPRLMGDTVLVETKKVEKDKDGNFKEEKNELKNIKGRVIDQNGIGIPFSAIGLKGTIKGVLSDEKGYYEIDVSGAGSKQVLVFSAIGFETVEISVASIKQPINCTLKLQPMIMGEIVVTGRCYREKKKGKKSDRQ